MITLHDHIHELRAELQACLLTGASAENSWPNWNRPSRNMPSGSAPMRPAGPDPR